MKIQKYSKPEKVQTEAFKPEKKCLELFTEQLVVIARDF